MKTYFTLLSFLRRAQKGNKGKRSETTHRIGRVVLLLIVVLYCWGMLLPGSYVAFGMLPSRMALPLLGAFFSSLLVASILIGLRVGYSLFAPSRDLPFLLSLPIPYRTVFAARLTMGYFSEISLFALFAAPVMIGYVAQLGSVVSVIASVLLLLLMPLFSLCISSLISLATVRLTRFLRRGEVLFSALSMVLILAVTFGIQFGVQNLAEKGSGELLDNIERIESTLQRFGRLFPPGQWAAESMTQPFHLGFWLFVLCTAVLCVLLIYAGGRLYSHGAIVLPEEGKKAGGKVAVQRQRGVLSSLMLRELRTITRSPTFAINLLSPFFIGPFLIVMMMFSTQSEGTDLVALLAQAPVYGFFVTVIAICFICSMNMIGNTALSREGRAIWLCQTIPVSPARQIAAKLLLAILFSLAEAIVNALLLLFILHLPVGSVAAGMAVGFLASIAPLVISALPDFYRPKLTWETERQAVKNNFNAVIGMFLSLFLLLPQAIVFVLCMVFDLPFWLMVAASVLLSAVEIAIIAALLPSIASASFARLSRR